MPGAAMEFGLKEAVVLAGSPLAASEMAELNPSTAAVVIEDVPVLPWITETDEGEAEIVKLGELDPDPVKAAMSAGVGLPHPVTRSKPVTAE